MSEAATPRKVSLPHRLGRLALPVTIFSIVYFGMLIYPPVRLLGLMFPAFVPGTPELLALIVGPILGRVAYEVRPSVASRMLAAASLTWLGLAFLLWCVIMPFELLNALLDLPGRQSGVVIASLWSALGLVALTGAQRLEVKHLAIHGARVPRPLTMVQISDVHIGSRAGGFLARVVDRVLPLEPDLVMITGDLVDFRDIPAAELAPLAQLQMPVFFCIGNHERYVDCDAICARLAGHGVRVLRDEIDTSQPGLVIVGIDDADSRQRVEQGLDALGALPEGYRILLYHRPDGLEDAARAGIDLMLCGHTHFGQIIPFNFLVKRYFPRIRGLYRVDPTRLYVSPGTGTWGPVLRLGSANEITLIELMPEP